METQILKRISETAHMSRTFKGARQRFAKDESGTMILFALILFVLMAMMGGIAVDLMRYETTRTTLQNTLDRSTLAAASLAQKLGAESVVRDYVAKAGMAQHLQSVTVTTGLNFKTVNAKGLADTKPLFLHMIGIDKFEAPGASTAEQRISNVEVMLVLDVSGSMAGTKMTKLKSAASKFVDTVLSSDDENRISIGLVPYNGQVNLGATMASKFNVTLPTGVANTQCVDLPSIAYTGTDMPRTLELPTTAYADTFSTTSQTTSFQSVSSNVPASANRWCPPSSVNIVRPPMNDIVALQGYINNMTAIGATSINAGLKWGLALLDPAARPIFAELAASSVIPATFNVRPFEYTDNEALKVIVLMTDGSHFAEERVKTAYKDGDSIIYKGGDGNYSIRHESRRPPTAGANEYFVPHLCTSNNCKNGTDVAEAWKSTPHSSGVVQSWKAIWADMRVSYVAWQFYGRALGTDSTSRTTEFNTAMSSFRSLTLTSTMDDQLQDICTMAKTKRNILIYGIAFDAPTAGAQQIRMCTSGHDPADPTGDNAYYFVSTPDNIKSAFNAIATNISQLRLTQ